MSTAFEALRKALRDDPAFSDVRQATRNVGPDESERIPDVLRLTYRDTPFFARLAVNKVVLEMTKSGGRIGTIGKPVRLPCDTLGKEIGRELDPYVRPRCRVTTDDEIVFDDVHRLWVHAFCRGVIQRRPIAALRDALHCPSCGLRVTVPRACQTPQELRRHFEGYNDD